MKFMGSKRKLLDGALGPLLLNEIGPDTNRFVDLFSGSGVVAWYVAERSALPVLAVDLQHFAAVLADAVIGRNAPVEGGALTSWLDRSRQWHDTHQQSQALLAIDVANAVDPAAFVDDARTTSASFRDGPISVAYGGHYFSPRQSAWIDALRATVPVDNARSVALASLVRAASRCSASPGHTAQPLQPSLGGWRHVRAAWSRDLPALVEQEFRAIALRYAQTAGSSQVASASEVAATLGPGDLAFVDPPYSAVQYSRFYHVLETIVQGSPGPVTGVGRYPARTERPQSMYSLKSKARESIRNLLKVLAERRVSTVLTFPRDETSLGVTGREIQAIGCEYFSVQSVVTNGRFSTLGGLKDGRQARVQSYELLLTMSPRTVGRRGVAAAKQF